ncbi:replication initiation factor domain-containing protein [Marinococcus luteus]|uniref:replication initiation factor domain-containing protein n=1 Tax=Marinococcus luteus TaxID=1122204 RepID=UPI002ACCB5CE|nr:replication initiation factor domain-containing protein [Marinococcus luteus]MDZ5784613.1 replication initiation factor domain-containing protein [Marinococcus luteus]
MASETRWKSTVFYGLDHRSETKYFGVRDSQRYIRLYDKKQERKDNEDEEMEAADLGRLEFELKRA